MKQFYSRLFITILTISFAAGLLAQCGAGYTQAQLNWDKLDLYFNNGTNVKPYGYGSGTYVTDAMEQTQKFAIGPNYITMATSSSALINPGTSNGVSAENTTHTGDLTGYTGADAQFNPSLGGQTITLTFNTEAANVSFSLYDIDGTGVITVSAVNAASTAQTVTTSNVGSNISISGSPSKTATSTTTSNLANNVNNGSVTFTIAGPVKTIMINVGLVGLDAVFWLSDINACVTGSFPTDYNRTPDNQPMTGPAGNQPDYFLITPDNNYCYMVDPATGVARSLFQDASKSYMNSFGYDPYNHYLYYIAENSSLNSNNKALKRYDFDTNTISTVLSDLTTLNIPTMNSGVESAGASFYNGNLYLGFEGGQYDNSNTRESIVYRLELNGSGVPVNAAQVFAVNSYSGSTGVHDWADFVVQNGILYNYNSRPGTSMISYEHYDLMTGQSTTYTNPNSGTGNAYQSGLTWAGDQYSFSSQAISLYNKNGTVNAPLTITLPGGGAFQGGAGDASENFRPKCDFGDAPSSYDPNPVSPAVYERSDNLRIGATWGSEWVKTSSAAANTDPDEDGVFTVEPLDTGTFNYAVDINVFNNSGANATVGAWLDFNANGVFDASEYVSTTVSSSASTQNVTLIWWFVNTPLTIGQSTYMRIRITPTSKGMGSGNATGYYEAGEVEDYQVQVDRVLPVSLLSFTAKAEGNSKVDLNWKVENESKIGEYKVERSLDGVNWIQVGTVQATNQAGAHEYSFSDLSPVTGKSYYRLQMTNKGNGETEKYSDTRTVNIKSGFEVTVTPNPVKDKARVLVEVSKGGVATVRVISIRGEVLESREVSVRAGMNTVELVNMQQYGSGAYILQVKTETETINKQFIIKHE